VGILGKLATLSGVKVDVVSIDSKVATSRKTGGGIATGRVAPRRSGVELDVEFNLVVLESNEGNGESGVLAEPETHGDVSLCGSRTSVGNVGSTLVSVSHTVVLGRLSSSEGRIENGLGTSGKEITLLAGRVDLAEIAPNAKPQSVLTVDQLTSNFDFENLEKGVAEIGGHLGNGGTSRGNEEAGVVLNPEILEEIAVTADGNTDP
jgi:hypothetical protein